MSEVHAITVRLDSCILLKCKIDVYSGNVELRYLEETENKPMKGEYKGSRFLLELVSIIAL